MKKDQRLSQKRLLTFRQNFRLISRLKTQPMKKIDILNFITNFRKSPNDVKTYQQILDNTGGDAQKLNELLDELKQTRVLKEIVSAEGKSYQVVTK